MVDITKKRKSLFPITNPAFIIGNGKSREGINLETLRSYGKIFGCNALYRDFTPDYLVAIDNKIIREIEKSDFPKDRFIVPPEHECYEPREMYSSIMPNVIQTPRSNAGMNAILEAIKRDHRNLFCLGFDFLITGNDELTVSNMYDGTNAYGPETRTSLSDSRRRENFLKFILIAFGEVHVSFVYPLETSVNAVLIDNFSILSYLEMFSILEKKNDS